MPPCDRGSKQSTALRSHADAPHPDFVSKPSAVGRPDGYLVDDGVSSIRFLELTVADLARDAMLIDGWFYGVNATRDFAADCEAWTNIPLHSRR